MLTTLTDSSPDSLAAIQAEKAIRKTASLVLLFSMGSQFDHLIVQQLAKIGVFCLVANPAKITAEDVEKVKREDPVAALDFPEFKRSGEATTYPRTFAVNTVGHFDRFVEQIPAFAAFVREHPHAFQATQGNGRKMRRKRRKMRTYWRKSMVENYARRHGIPALKQMHDLINWTMPWWAKAMAQQGPELRLAA